MSDIISVIFAGATLLLLACGVYAWQVNPRAHTNLAMLALCALMAIGNGGQVLGYAVHSKAFCLFWNHVSWFGWSLYPAAAVWLAVLVTEHADWLRRWWVRPLLLLPGTVIFVRSLFGLLGVSDFYRTALGTYLPIHRFDGWDLAFVYYQYGFDLIALALIACWGLASAVRRSRRQALIILCGALIALALDAIHYFAATKGELSVIWAIEQLIFAGSLTYAVTRHQFVFPTSALAANYISHHVNELVVLTTLEGHILQVNPAGQALLGAPERVLLGRPLAACLVPNDPLHGIWPLPGCCPTASSWHEVCFADADGVAIPVSLTCSHLRDRYGDTIGIVAIGEDLRQRTRLQREIDERLAAERELRLAHDTLEEQVHQRTAELQALATQLLQVEARERRRMALCLHDIVIQNLALTQIMLGGVRAQLAPDMAGTLEQVRDVLDETIKEVRSLTFELSPPILHELGLSAAVEWLADQFSQRYNLLISIDGTSPEVPLNDDLRTLLFTATREVLVNIIKHARATRVAITLQWETDAVAVRIEDDGIGFDVRRVENPRANRGFGLFSIRERLRHLGGALELVSHAGHGTRVTLRMPVPTACGVMEGL